MRLAPVARVQPIPEHLIPQCVFGALRPGLERAVRVGRNEVGVLSYEVENVVHGMRKAFGRIHLVMAREAHIRSAAELDLQSADRENWLVSHDFWRMVNDRIDYEMFGMNRRQVESGQLCLL